MTPLRVLLVEDSPTDAKLVLRELAKLDRVIESERVETEPALRAALEKSWDVILCDWSMPKFSARGALAVVKELGLDVPIIIVSGTIGEETAVEAMRGGAYDYVLKGKLGRLTAVIERELREASERAGRKLAEAALRTSEAALRASEEQLRHAQKMEAVGRLAGGVAHDFNNILSIILSYSELLLEAAQSGDPMRDDLDEIRKAALRASGLTRQLLLFSRQQVTLPKVMDLNEVLGSMDKMLKRVLGEDVDLVSLPGKSLGRVRVDPGHIEQVILNLVVNARDAMPQGGKLTIETANVVLDDDYAQHHLPTKTGPHVMLAVTDTGAGIEKSLQSRVFEPFFTTKPKSKGTGLGLSTVFGIVQQSGGNIWLYSEVGRGTTFKIYLPRIEAAPDALRSHAAQPMLRGSETILVVEDEEQVRAVVISVLRRQGYQVLPAENAGVALLLCESHGGAIDLLLTDVVMPQMSGPELAKRLLPSRPSMKVLCMSGYTDDSIVRHGVLDSGVAYLQKPFTPASLGTKVREVLDGITS